MKNKLIITVMLTALFLTATSTVLAKRAAPNEVKPITVGQIEYRAPMPTAAGQMGYVEAWDTSKEHDRLLWRRQIYAIEYDSNLERDVQDVFITSMKLKDNVLLITNERDSEYELDLKTLEVKVIKGSLVETK